MTSPLALLGGPPAVTWPAPHFTWPPVDDQTVAAVTSQLRTAVSVYDRSGVIAGLEDALCGYFGVRHAVLTSSGTAALYDLYAVCGIGPGDEVIVPAYTFYATVTPLLHLGAVPVLADCDHDGNLDPADAARKVTARTTAITVTHMWGMPADMPALRALADAHGLNLIEDASHAHGASIAGRKTGTFGTGAAFSMNGPKPLSAGEGGFILTDNEIYYRALLRGHYNKRCRSEIPPAHQYDPYAVTGAGLKHRIHPLAASIALDQLGHLDTYLDGRARIATAIAAELDGIPGIRTLSPGRRRRSAWYGMILQ
jgi:perosamine synthetase